jgi:hypothetical protein
MRKPRLKFVFLPVLALAALSVAASGPESNDPPTLNVVASGILSRGTGFFDDMEAMRTKGKTYRIKIEGDEYLSKLEGLTRFLGGSEVDATETIRVKDANDPALTRFIQKIASEQNVTVLIDMDLWTLGHKDWDVQTDHLANIAARLGEERLKQKPNSSNIILAHSAATVGLSKLTSNPETARLYQNKFAASPQTWNLSKDVVILHEAGDLTRPSSLKDKVNLASLKETVDLTTQAARDSEGWASRGNLVIRKDSGGFDSSPLTFFWSHPRTHQLGLRDKDVEVLVPTSTTNPGEPPSPVTIRRFVIPSASTGKVIQAIEGRAGPAFKGPDSDSRMADFDRLKTEMEKSRPPKGGGIALRATAELSIGPSEVSSATWDEASRRVILIRTNGTRLSLPPMDPEIAYVAYLCGANGKWIDPEFSIGASLAHDREDSAAPGRHPAYYLGPVEETLFGLILVRADVALGEIAYGGSPLLAARGLDQVAGYHSLPEMYPAKYTDHPKRDSYLGISERVVIESLPTQLVMAGEDRLAYTKREELAVRFGRTTPAERAYSEIFSTNYFPILESTPELRDLVECARAIGVFKWLHENSIEFAPGGSFAGFRPADALTPHQVAQSSKVEPETLTARRPVVYFGEHGPTEIYRGSGEPIRLTYGRGRISSILRPDGRALRVYVDDLGEPMAVEVESVGTGAFVRLPNGQIAFVDGVSLVWHDGRVVGFEPSDKSPYLPATEPWELINTLALSFVREMSA